MRAKKTLLTIFFLAFSSSQAASPIRGQTNSTPARTMASDPSEPDALLATLQRYRKTIQSSSPGRARLDQAMSLARLFLSQDLRTVKDAEALAWPEIRTLFSELTKLDRARLLNRSTCPNETFKVRRLIGVQENFDDLETPKDSTGHLVPKLREFNAILDLLCSSI